MTPASSRLGVGGRVVATLVGLAFVVASAVVAPLSSVLPTTYAATSTSVLIVYIVAGAALLLAAAAAIWARPGDSLGPIVAATGVVWFAADWVGWSDGPPLVRSVAMVAVVFTPALLVHLAAAFPAGAVTTRMRRMATAAAYVVAGGVAIGLAAVRDPFADVHCWRNCSENSLLLHDDPAMAQWFAGLGLRSTVLIGVLVAASCAWRLKTATRVARGMLAPVLVPLALAAVTEATFAATLVLEPAEDPERALFAALFVARATSLTLLAAGVAWVVVRDVRTRLGVDRIARHLGEAPEPGSLAAALGRSLRDRDVSVYYWLYSSSRYVDSSGRPASPDPRPGQSTTVITRLGQPVAAVVHDASLADAAQVGATARLAVDNERLRAEVLAQLDDLRRSRRRVVAQADATRRAGERDLHDGAQQRLLAASYELRLAASAAAEAGDAALAGWVDAALTETQQAMQDLRDLAHGIFPAILAEAGLGAAVMSLALTAPVPVELNGFNEPPRLTDGVELAAYRFVDVGISDAAARDATHVAVDAAVRSDHLVVEVRDDGREATPQIIELADRVGAVGGSVEVGPGRRRAVLPCG